MVEESFSSESVPCYFNAGANFCLVPKFNEKDPDTFFTLFECIMDAKNWLAADRTLMLRASLLHWYW